MRRRLVAASVGVVVAVLVVAAFPIGLTIARSERTRLRAEVQQDAFAIASYADAALRPGPGVVADADRVALQRLADGYEARTGGRVVVIDRRGVAVADSTPPSAGVRTFATRPEVRRALEGHVAAVTRRSDTLGGGSYLFVAVPVASGRELLGAVRVSVSTEDVDRRVREVWLALAATAVVSVLVAAMSGSALARWVAAPLAVLETTAAVVGAGDLAARAPTTSGPPEVRALAFSFNEMAARLATLVESQEAFVADASHQLRSPLTALRLRLENLAAAVEGDAASARDVAAAEADVSRLSRLVDQLLALARLDQGAFRPPRSDVALDAVVRERCDAWEPVAAEQRVAIRAETAPTPIVAATPDYVEQVLDNLVANALDAAPPGSVIRLRCEVDADAVAVHVEDEGPGLPDEDRERAFDRFWRGRRGEDRSRHGGSGLGLAIVQKLVEADGADVALHAATGGGIDAVVRYRRP